MRRRQQRWSLCKAHGVGRTIGAATGCDVATAARRRDDNSHPVAADAPLVVEVADTTLEYDIEVKRPLYARAGVAEPWIVDINRGELWHRAPANRERDASIHCVLTASVNAAVSLPRRRWIPVVSALVP